MDLAELYQKQISFTEWFEAINHRDTAVLRLEDNTKRERLAQLGSYIEFPFDRPVSFDAAELAGGSERLRSYVAEHGDEVCALRLNPRVSSLPKKRMRGMRVREVLEWFKSLAIDPANYTADFVPHAQEYEWSTIFVVTGKGIFGEIIRGGHYQLTQGFYEHEKPIVFSFDFKDWKLSEEHKGALEHLKRVLPYLHVSQSDLQESIKDAFNAEFSHDYLCGYFETVSSRDMGLWFVDWNRLLANMFDTSFSLRKGSGDISGFCANAGSVRGRVRIVKSALDHFAEGDILVCAMTTPELVSLMAKSGAIVTDLGGILTHAAIISRELGKPCIVGTGNATKLLRDGQEVEVDATNGVVRGL